MTSDIDKIRKVIELFSKKKFSELEKTMESFGNIDKATNQILNLYSLSKLLNINSKKEDYLLAAKYLDKIYSSDTSQKIHLHNLIIASINSNYFGFVERYLNDEYLRNPYDPRILEGLSKMEYSKSNMKNSSKYFGEYASVMKTNFKAWSSYLSIASLNGFINQEKYLEFCKKVDDIDLIKTETPINKIKEHKIKLAFISGDFANHSVSFFLRDILMKINKSKFKLFALSNRPIFTHDETTIELKKYFDQWEDVFDMDDEKLLSYGRSLNIDILIDLSGYTSFNRVNVVRSRISPIQISWLGYLNSLGLKNIDYLIADKNLIPENEKKQYLEKIIYMPNIWNSLSKPDNLPVVKNDNVDFVFGSFNNFNKISDSTVKVWSKILNSSKSKLLLKTSSADDFNYVKKNMLKKFSKYNVDLDKINILEKVINFYDHLELYNKIDLALDTFPHNGVTTTFEAVLMGVPVLTMKGTSFSSRCGESINNNLKLKDLIAKDSEDYINKAINFAKDKKKLLNKFNGNLLRDKSLKSSLFDTSEFTFNLEKKMVEIYNEIYK
jgi:predicted O-linked N-acetylglucosamine transferase (SPINDLY family)